MRTTVIFRAAIELAKEPEAETSDERASRNRGKGGKDVQRWPRVLQRREGERSHLTRDKER